MSRVDAPRAGAGAGPAAGGTRALVADGVATRAMDALTGGGFLTGLALLVGAGDAQLGLLAAIPFLAQLLQLPGVLVLERWPDRRRISLLSSAAARTLLLAAGFLPLALGARATFGHLLALVAAMGVASAFGGAAWNAWLREVLPPDRMGRVFARRLAAQGLTALALALPAGLLLDALRAQGRAAEGFALLYALGVAAGYAGLAFLARIPHPRPAPPARRRSLGTLLATPYRDANFRGLMAFNASWGFAVNLAAPFITVFMLVRLGLPFALLGLFVGLATLASVLALPVWGRLSDRFGNKPVLAICAPVFSLSLLLWVFAVRDTAFATVAIVALIHLLNGFAAAGLDLASNNILLKLAPADQAASYLASASVTRAAASAAGPVAGGLLAAWFAPRSLRFDVAWQGPGGELVLTPVRLAHYDFVFLLAAVLGLYAVHRLVAVREEGEAPRGLVLRALRSELGVAGTFMGLRRFANVGNALADLVWPRRPPPRARPGAPPPPEATGPGAPSPPGAAPERPSP